MSDCYIYRRAEGVKASGRRHDTINLVGGLKDERPYIQARY
jgi:hypothetical protein